MQPTDTNFSTYHEYNVRQSGLLHEEQLRPTCELRGSSDVAGPPSASDITALRERRQPMITSGVVDPSEHTSHDRSNYHPPLPASPSPLTDEENSIRNNTSTINENRLTTPQSMDPRSSGCYDDPLTLLSNDQLVPEPAEALPAGPNTNSPASNRTSSSAPSSSSPPDTWKPLYLDWRVLICFSVFFGSTLIAIEIIASISRQKHGLATARPQLHYLWKYGTTAIFTLITTVWTRVEFNVKRVAPWLQLSSGPKDADRTVLLDYVTPFPTTAVYRAIKYKDLYVVAAILVTFILRVLIVLSTSLITLVPVPLELHGVPTTLQQTFRTTIPDGWPLPGFVSDPANSIKAQVFRGLINGENPYPVGLTESLTYPDFSVDQEGIENSSLTVDAFSGMLECKESNFIKLSPGMLIKPSFYYTQTVQAENCTYTLNLTFPVESPKAQYYGRVLLSSCQENAVTNDTSYTYPAADRRNYTLQILVMETMHKKEESSKNDSVITRVMERTCSPSFIISNASVARSMGKMDSISVMDQKPRVLPEANPWAGFADLEEVLNNNCTHGGSCLSITFGPNGTYFGGGCTTSCELKTIVVKNKGDQSEIIALDPFFAMALRKGLQTSPVTVAEQFFNATFIDDTMDRLFASYGAFLGYLLYRDGAKGATTTATVTVTDNRLLVTETVANTMSALLGLCLILSASMIALLPRRGALPPCPTTIADMVILTRQSQPFMQIFHGLGISSEKDIRSQMQSKSFKLELVCATETGRGRFVISQARSENNPEQHSGSTSLHGGTKKVQYPLVLHPATRLVVTLLIVAIIVALEITLRQSEHNNGLMAVAAEDYVQYGWMIIPGIIFSLISLYYGAMEFQVRLLAPYQNLSSGAPARVTLSLDLTDKLSATTFVAAVRVRQFAVAVAVLAAFIASFLTIASASLFAVQNVSMDKVSAYLIPQDTLDYEESWSSRSSNSSSLLAANLDYPPFTFNELVYPSLRWNKSLSNHFSTYLDEDDMLFEANIPAARSVLNCTMYTRPHLEATLGISPALIQDFPYIHVKLPGKNCTGMEDSFYMAISDSLITRSFYFGIALPGSSLVFDDTAEFEDNNIMVGCTSYLYGWGKILNWTNNEVSSIVVMGCDEQIQEINTRLTLFGSDLEIRNDHPPQPDDSSAHALMHSPKECTDYDDLFSQQCSSLPNLYEDLSEIETSEALDNFFSALTFPGGKFALDQSLLGNESMAELVAGAVVSQHEILRGQAFSRSGRISIDIPDSESPIANLSGLHSVSFLANASATSQTRSRIVQDALATRILEGLLGTVLALSCLCWIASPHTKVLPRSPMSIASVAAWIADGDVFDLLPRDINQMTRSDLADVFSDEHFYMRMDKKGRLGIRSALATFTKERNSLAQSARLPDLAPE
ncbi:hypothetical protein F4777DRAFT_572590 [Nemania sp. FL0916]|nr:hypothetical protein F4777DRAFT_572590 [Nemania sp. FL0916]